MSIILVSNVYKFLLLPLSRCHFHHTLSAVNIESKARLRRMSLNLIMLISNRVTEQALTCSPSCGGRVLNEPSNTYKPRNILFKRLPVEIRRQILIAAFGNQIVHIDICGRQTAQTSSCERAGGSKLVPVRHPINCHRCALAETTRHWRSSVCHRTAPSSVERMPLGKDRCLEGEACCDIWPGKVGASGWLLSCRQA
jgi:hypothetical protein